MQRRAFLAALGGGLVAGPIGAGAQPARKVWRVGLVSIGTDPGRPERWQPFVVAMRDLGFVEGRNLEIKRVVAGLMSYRVSFPDLLRRAAVYVDKIIEGARPGDLPVEQPTRFELVVDHQVIS